MKACFLLVAAALAVPLKSAVLPFGPDLIADYTTFAVKHVHSLAVVGEAQALSIAAATAADLGVSPSDMRVTWSYKSDIGLNHVYMVQTLNGLDIVNAVMNVNLDAYGQKLSIGSTLFKPAFSEADMGSNEQINLMARTVLQKPVKTPTEGLNALLMHVSLETAVISSIVETQGSWVIIVSHPVKATVPVKLAYLTGKDRNSVKLVYDLEIDLKDNWYSAQVDAVTGEVLNMVDYVSHSTFNVYPVGQNDPGTGKRSLLKDPENLLASPLGWNARIAKNKLVDYSTTYGNNVYASDNPTGGDDDSDNFRPDGGPHHNFDFPINFKKEPDTYLSAAITNLFYWNNIMHDLFYLYGFNEASGNFQDYNFGRGGLGGDAVSAFAQDGSGTNNANFATPPDGSQPRMRMYIWTETKPSRDGDLESGIVIHEYSHGISNRLTGGGKNTGCLPWGEAGGMGEGWGDFFATILSMDSKTTRHDDFAMGAYSAGGSGIRYYPYSTNMTTNPSTYGFVRRPKYWGVHAKGEVWAAILYEVYWNLVEKHGWEDDWFDVPTNTESSGTSKAPKAGNKLALRLVMEGLKLQPCYPSFPDARDAILLADEILTKGANKCIIWKGFAKRGLGVGAIVMGTETFDVPEECK